MRPIFFVVGTVLAGTVAAQAQFGIDTYFLFPPSNNNCFTAHLQATTDSQQVGGFSGFVPGTNWFANVHAAIWWSFGGPIGVDLNPPGQWGSWAYANRGEQQAGYSVSINAVIHAAIWYGSPASWVDLNPVGGSSSVAYATTGTQQAGQATFGTQGHAGIWSGSAGTWVDLNPPGVMGSIAFATTGSQQAGAITDPATGLTHAALWSGTATSWVDLNSPGTEPSTASAAGGNQQAGWATGISGQQHAAIWSGSAGSWVDLNPPGALRSLVNATTGNIQAGTALIGTSFQAGIWFGTSNSWLSLGQGSASGVWSNNYRIYVVGQSGPYVGNCDPQAVLWVLSNLPEIGIEANGPTTKISWDGKRTNYSLEATSDLTRTNWGVVTNVPQIDGPLLKVLLSYTNRVMFFRLRDVR